MPHRVSPTERVRGHIDELFAQDKQLPEILEEVARLGAQLLMQAALEAEITEFLGRDRYQRAAACGMPVPGRGTGTGKSPLRRPPGRCSWPGRAARHRRGVRVPAVRGPRDQDERAGIAGDRLVRARPVGARRGGRPRRGPRRPGRDLQVHRVGHLPADQGRVRAWSRRRLDGITLDYLFLDASFFRMHPARRPSRCWRPGASPPRASPRSSAWVPAQPSPPTPGRISWLT